MKKSFVYLICMLLMAALLCGCGASSTDSGMVSSSPAQTLPTATATVMPTASPMASADAGTGSQTSSPSVSGSAGNSSGSAAESAKPSSSADA